MAAHPQSAEAAANIYNKNVEALEKIFTDAIAYAAVEKPKDVNLRLESMRGLFDGTKILFISATESKGIIAAISIREKIWCKKDRTYRS